MLSRRLCREALSDLKNLADLPEYDVAVLKAGIVHLGIGAFHRAHQAEYTHKVLNTQGGDWGIIGVSLRSGSVADQLNPQDGLYTRVEQSHAGDQYEIIGSVKQVLVAPDDPKAVLDALSDEAIKVVSMTITEKGYCHDPASGELNFDSPDVVHDLANPDKPKTAIGFLVYSLQRRMALGIKPFTPLTCDNLPHNGALLANLVKKFAALVDPALGDFIETHVRFPSTMVDRIVPATLPEDIKSLKASLGVEDCAMVKAEPFSQWVIEDAFCNERPAWENTGANLVADVRLFEEMKLRLLNGSHSSIAYLGYLAGYKTVADVVKQPAFAAFIRRLMDKEISPSLVQPEGIDLATYKAQLMTRFSNPMLKHKTHQIAMDGSQKIPQRLLNTLRYCIDKHLDYDCIALVIAAWIHYVRGVDNAGDAIEVQDPMADEFVQLRNISADDPQANVTNFMGIRQIFSTDLVSNPELVVKVTTYYSAIKTSGVATYLREFMGRVV